MIARLKGEVIEKDQNGIIVDVGGVGYQVAASLKDLDSIILDDPVTLYTYLHVRENSMELFGFLEYQALQLFESLISVSGVGPKMAVSILGLGDQRQIRRAIASGNTTYITGASGVGKRLAERLVVDLKDKVGVIAGTDVGLDDEALDSGDDAVDALVSLGYSKAQVIKALSKINPELPVEEKVRAALKKI